MICAHAKTLLCMLNGLIFSKINKLISVQCHIGEACGEGTLIVLQDQLEAKHFQYSCYNIYGDLNDESQLEDLSLCASHIVNATQKGTVQY